MPIEGWGKEKIVLEGAHPERALKRLVKSGITVFWAKKIKKNQIMLLVSKKDSEKVFAIYPDLCYNKNNKKAYVARKAGKVGIYKYIHLLKNRFGIALGIALFLANVTFCQSLIFRVEFVTADYQKEGQAILHRYGITPFSLYPKDASKKASAELMGLPFVTFATVQKKGMCVTVEIRTSPFSEEKLVYGDMIAKHSGTISQILVLRGTALKAPSMRVEVGDVLVGGYFLLEDGKWQESYPVAKVKILVTEQRFLEGEQVDPSFPVDGEVVEKKVERTDEGAIVTIVYEAVETMNFGYVE